MDSHATQPATQPAPLKRLKTGPGTVGTAPGLEEARQEKPPAHATDPAPPSWVQMQLDAFPVL